MKRAILLIIPLVFGQMAQAQLPKADDILATARYVATLQNQNLTGHLRKGDKKIPVGLFLMGEKIQFTFLSSKTGKYEPFEMRLKKDHYDLLEQKNGETVEFPQSKLGEAIEGTDVSYVDLAMHFLYWPKGQVIGDEKVKGQDCWKVRLQNPGKGGRYRLVYVWVHKKAGALMHVVGYNGDNPAKALKRFLVNEIMKVGDAYTLREMRVSSFDPKTNTTVGLQSVEFDKPKKSAPKGVR